jgi:hypothetical protein
MFYLPSEYQEWENDFSPHIQLQQGDSTALYYSLEQQGGISSNAFLSPFPKGQSNDFERQRKDRLLFEEKIIYRLSTFTVKQSGSGFVTTCDPRELAGVYFDQQVGYARILVVVVKMKASNKQNSRRKKAFAKDELALCFGRTKKGDYLVLSLPLGGSCVHKEGTACKCQLRFVSVKESDVASYDPRFISSPVCSIIGLCKYNAESAGRKHHKKYTEHGVIFDYCGHCYAADHRLLSEVMWSETFQEDFCHNERGGTYFANENIVPLFPPHASFKLGDLFSDCKREVIELNGTGFTEITSVFLRDDPITFNKKQKKSHPCLFNNRKFPFLADLPSSPDADKFRGIKKADPFPRKQCKKRKMNGMELNSKVGIKVRKNSYEIPFASFEDRGQHCYVGDMQRENGNNFDQARVEDEDSAKWAFPQNEPIVQLEEQPFFPSFPEFKNNLEQDEHVGDAML